MSHFKAKMHQIQFRLGLRPRLRWGAYSSPLDHLAGFKGPVFEVWGKGKGGRKRRRKKEGEEEEDIPLPTWLQPRSATGL